MTTTAAQTPATGPGARPPDPITVDINRTAGAPGPTAVFSMATLPNHDECRRILERTFPALRDKAAFTKVLFAALSGPGHFTTRFLQLDQPRPDALPTIHTGRDCINSAVAAYPTLRSASDGVAVVNADTGLSVELTGVDALRVAVRITPPAPIVAPQNRIGVPTQPGLLALQVTNPYVLADAAMLGLRARDLLRLDGPVSTALLEPLTETVAQVRARLELPEEDGLPKVAIVAGDGTATLTARTVYLGRWHPGLPLTAAVTICAATQIPETVWHRPAVLREGLWLRTSGGTLRVSVDTGLDTTLRSFHIPDREVHRVLARHLC